MPTAAPRRPAAPAVLDVPSWIEAGLIVAGLWLFWSRLPFRISGDGALRFEALTTLLSEHRVPASRYSLLMPLAAAPFHWLGRWWASPAWWCARFNCAIFTAGLGGFALLLPSSLGGAVTRRFLLLLVCASMFPFHLQDFYGETFSVLLTALGLAALATRRGRWGWIAAVVGTANAPGTLVGLAAASVSLARIRKSSMPLLLPALAALLWVFESWIARGSPFITGYEHDHGFPATLPSSAATGFGYSMFFGVLGILFSFGRGLIFYVPGLFLPAPDRTGRLAQHVAAVKRTWIWFVVGLVPVYAKWWAWHGGWFWGPRFFLFACMPAALVLALRIGDRGATAAADAVTLGVLGLSVWVGLDGAAFGLQGMQPLIENNFALEHLALYVPEYSALWHPFAFPQGVSDDQLVLAGFFALAGACLAAPITARLLRRRFR